MSIKRIVIVAVVVLLTAVSAVAQPPSDPRGTPKGPRQIFPVAPRAGVVRAAPANDNFADAKSVTFPLPYSDTVGDFDQADPDGEAGEPQSCSSKPASIWYTLTPSSDTVITVDTEGSTFDTVLSIYTGATLGNLTELACNDDFSAVTALGLTSTIMNVAVSANTTYRIRVSALDSATLLEGESATLNIKVTPPAQTFVVNSTLDAIDASVGNGTCASPGGTCTLRAAIMEANASRPGSTITVPAGLYAITRAPGNLRENASVNGDLDVVTSMTINGAGARATVIDGSDLENVMEFLNGSNVTLSGVTIRNGKRQGSLTAGGGVRIDSAFATLTNVWVTGNEAMFGGGITVEAGSLVMSNSAITGNVATGRNVIANYLGGSGGGLEVRDQLGQAVSIQLTNVTFSGNVAATPDASVVGKGGAVYLGSPNISGSLNVAFNNVTIAANTATNGGGIFKEAGGTIAVRNTLIGDNVAANNPDCRGNIGSQGSNVIENVAGCTANVTDIMNQDVRLNVLSLNAPGSTPTHLPMAASPARNAANAAGCSPADQRGISRSAAVNGGCDIGALEAVVAVPGAFTLEAPAHDLVIPSPTGLTQFTWTPSVNALSYVVKLDSISSGTPVNIYTATLYANEVCSPTLCTASFAGSLADDFYRYSVTAYADTNVTSATTSHVVQVDSVAGLPNLLTNGGFETKGLNGQALKWGARGISGDKRMCNRDGIVYSYKENCAYRFKGTKLENTTLRQKLNLSGLTLEKDKRFRFSFYTKTGAAVKATATLKVVYKRTSITPSKRKIVLPAGDQTWVPLSADLILKDHRVDRVILIFKHTTKTGSWFIDEARAVYIDGTTTVRESTAATRDAQNGDLLPVPAAPDGFRGSN
jgi:CSLREA domain-containing protein